MQKAREQASFSTSFMARTMMEPMARAMLAK
jgi:hypothetical protein